MNKLKIILTIITIAAVVSMGGFCSLALAQSSKVIKVGYTAPFTGAAAEFGTNGWRGVQLALEDINKKGIQVNDTTYKIEIIRYDSVCKPTEAVANVRRLIMEDKVVAILGDHCSSCCLAIAPLCDDFKIPGLTVECMADDITSPGHPFYFRIYIPSGLIAVWLAPVIKERLHPERVAFLGINDDYGRSHNEGISEELAKLGVKTVAKEYYERGTTDYYVLLSKIMKANPDIVVFVGVTPEAGMALRQAREIGLVPRVRWLGSVESSEEEILEKVGPEMVEGTYAWAVWGEVPGQLVRRVKKKFNAPMHYGIVYGYDSLQVIARAIELAQSVDPVKIRDAMEKLDFQGLSGHVKFENFDAPNGRHYEHQVKQPPLLIKWVNGQRQVVRETGK